MRLGIVLLNSSSTVNNMQKIQSLRVARGETANLYFQLIDLDQKDNPRYIPEAGATMLIQISRSLVVAPAAFNQRTTTDYSIERAGVNPFAGDTSVWSTPLTATDTQNMISNSIKVVLTEGSQTKIATLNAAIRVIDGQDK